MIMSVVGQAVLSAVLKVLFDRLASPQLLTFARQDKQVYDQFKKWEKTLLQMHAVLDDAEDKQMTNQSVKVWLADLRDFAYDVEDLLDEFTTEASNRGMVLDPLVSSSSSTSSKVRQFIQACNGLVPSSVMFKVRMSSKMKRVTGRLQELSTRKGFSELRENMGGRNGNQVRERLPTTSLVNEAQVFGRENDKEALLELVLKDNFECGSSGICVVSIIGMGGVGKTTLAQLIFNDEKVRDWFDLRLWACLSDEFDVLKVTKTVLESATRGSVGLSNLNLLQGRLQDVLTDKKFLLVLDDVWNENYNNWEVLCSPFRSGAAGSKIIVTTRNEGVASTMGSVAAYRLRELSYDSCLPLFTQLALGAENFDAHPNLKAIGEGIVMRCKGLPLAAKTLGSLLRTIESQDEWEEVLHSKIWELPEEKSPIIPALRLSYHYLPSNLKQCFAYCSIFPKDYEFSKEELILLWMAEGFLQQPRGTRIMENLGAKYFDVLLSRSLFQQSSSNRSRYLMHDLINDLAQYVAGEACIRLEDTENLRDKVLEKTRHASYLRSRHEVFKKFEVLYKARRIRSFLPLPVHIGISWSNFYMTKKVMYDLLPKLSCLRVLSFSGYCISELPDSIGKLKLLRYLDLSYTLIRTLPESLCALCNLQTLKLHDCSTLSKLPAGIVNLTNLRHLDISNTRQLQEMPLHMGKLANLRTLPKFTVGRSYGSRIAELRNMLRLRGKLAITGLHNVASSFDAGEANLQSKKDIEELEMEWSGNIELQNQRDCEMELNVLDMLQPHKNLKKLKIQFYAGTKFPSWIEDPSFYKLVSLTFSSCTRCTSLPALGKLPSLENLCVQGMQGIKTIGVEFYGEGISTPFPSLKTLSFVDMLEWEDWSSAITEGTFESEFPCLLELHIKNCPKLTKRLPNHLPSLVELDISKCPLFEVQPLRFSSLCNLKLEECNETALGNTVYPTSITNLQLRGISNLRELPDELMQASPALKVMSLVNCGELATLRQIGNRMLHCRLEFLELYNCSNLKELPEGFFNCTYLTDLKIKRCPRLVSIPELGLPCMLKHLIIEECEDLRFLPNGIMMPGNGEGSSTRSNISYLERLEIIKCPSLKSFPRGELPNSLKMLKIWDCRQLDALPDMMLQNAISLECLSVRKYTNLKTLPDLLCRLTRLVELHISYCTGIESFPERGLPIPNLRRFYVFSCPNLTSLPEHMQNLTSLQHLGVSSCPRLVSLPEGGLPPNLISLRVSNCENLPTLSQWGLNRLMALKDFAVSGGCTLLITFDCRLPPTLTSLRIGKLLNLESFSTGLQNLTSLEVLEISECPKLRSLPKEGLPATLAVLEISDCPILKRKLLKKNGKQWLLIANIPRVQVDEVLIH